MMTVNIRIDSVEKVKKFSSIICREDVNCELIQGAHILDGKSIMGIFSMDLKEPIQLKIHSENKEILNKLQEFIVG